MLVQKNWYWILSLGLMVFSHQARAEQSAKYDKLESYAQSHAQALLGQHVNSKQRFGDSVLRIQELLEISGNLRLLSRSQTNLDGVKFWIEHSEIGSLLALDFAIGMYTDFANHSDSATHEVSASNQVPSAVANINPIQMLSEILTDARGILGVMREIAGYKAPPKTSYFSGPGIILADTINTNDLTDSQEMTYVFCEFDKQIAWAKHLPKHQDLKGKHIMVNGKWGTNPETKGAGFATKNSLIDILQSCATGLQWALKDNAQFPPAEIHISAGSTKATAVYPIYFYTESAADHSKLVRIDHLLSQLK